MRPEASPFTPGQPVPTEFFVGRLAEIERLRAMVGAATQGKFRTGFVTGERGIGKSSLVSFVRHLAEREQKTAGAHVYLGGVNDLGEMVRRVFDRLLKESSDKPWYEKLRTLFGAHVKQLGLFGISVEFDVPKPELPALVHGFSGHLRKILQELQDSRHALILILDDINDLAGSKEFANWLKSFVDETATSGAPLPVCLWIVGLEERRQEMIRLQPSLARIFDLIDIHPWAAEEAAEFFRTTFHREAVDVEAEALQIMVEFCGGLPVLAHEIGDAVWRLTERPPVTPALAWRGVFEAAEIIGRKLLEPQVLQAIHSQRYRSILRKLSRPPATSFRRAELLRTLSAEEKKVCDNFLNRMRKLNVIVRDPEGGPGAYRFSNRLHSLYFSIEAQRAARQRG